MPHPALPPQPLPAEDRLLTTKEARTLICDRLGIGKSAYYEVIRPQLTPVWLGHTRRGGVTRAAVCRVPLSQVTTIIDEYLQRGGGNVSTTMRR